MIISDGINLAQLDRKGFEGFGCSLAYKDKNSISQGLNANGFPEKISSSTNPKMINSHVFPSSRM